MSPPDEAGGVEALEGSTACAPSEPATISEGTKASVLVSGLSPVDGVEGNEEDVGFIEDEAVGLCY